MMGDSFLITMDTGREMFSYGPHVTVAKGSY